VTFYSGFDTPCAEFSRISVNIFHFSFFKNKNKKYGKELVEPLSNHGSDTIVGSQREPKGPPTSRQSNHTSEKDTTLLPKRIKSTMKI